MFCSVDWYLVTGVSRQPIGPVFKGQAVKGSLWASWRWIDKLSWNVGN